MRVRHTTCIIPGGNLLNAASVVVRLIEDVAIIGRPGRRESAKPRLELIRAIQTRSEGCGACCRFADVALVGPRGSPSRIGVINVSGLVDGRAPHLSLFLAPDRSRNGGIQGGSTRRRCRKIVNRTRS